MQDGTNSAQRRRNQQTLAELIERAPFGVYIVDSDLRIALMNRGSQSGAFKNVYPLIGRDLSEAMHTIWPEPVAQDIVEKFRHTLSTGEPYSSSTFIKARQDIDEVQAYEWELHRLTLPDGKFGVVCYYYDSTRLRKVEAEADEYKNRLRLEEERLRLLRTAAKVTAWQYNPEEGTFEWTDSVLDLFGGKAIGSDLASFLSLLPYSSDRENAKAALDPNRRKRDFEFSFRYVCPDKTIKLITARGRSFYNLGSNIVLGMFIDSTSWQPTKAPTERRTRNR